MRALDALQNQVALLDKQRVVQRLRRWWRRPFSSRLLITPQYSPRPIHIPDRYARAPRPSNPPVISIVTPSFNQGRFLQKTIGSVLDQKYPALEYIIQDGGSSDETPRILRQYAPYLYGTESKIDRGQTHAINLGFEKATGEVLAYLNSDDLLLPGTLNYVASFFTAHPEVDVVYGHRVLIDDNDGEVGRWVLPPHNDGVLRWSDFVPQETLFWRRRLWEHCGGSLDESFQFAMDWDLLLRFQEAGARFVRLPRFLAAFRIHPQQKSQAQIEIGLEEMARLRERCHRRRMSEKEIRGATRSYICRHVLFHNLYKCGVLRY